MNTVDVSVVDVNAVWKNSLHYLLNKEKTNTPLTQTYFDYLVPVSVDEQCFTFAIRNLHAKDWIEKRYLDYIKEAVSQVLGSPREVLLVIDETAKPSSVDTRQAPRSSSFVPSSQAPPSVVQQFGSSSQTTGAQPQTNPGTQQNQQGLPHTDISSPVVPFNQSDTSSMGSGLSSVFAPDDQSATTPAVEPDERFSFSSYVVGDSNDFACMSARRVAEGPGLYFNPLFIYGKSGLGKTHLLLAVKNYINSYFPEKRVVYAPTSEFVSDFTNAMAADRDLTSFKRKYHTCDVLLIDDVQNLSGKVSTTDALFDIFNMFIEQRKQIVLSADRSPVEIDLDERYTSRFKQGVTTDIQPPNYEMKTAILMNYKRYYCNFLNIPEVDFSEDAIQKIVELSGSNIRELEGAISNLIMFMFYQPDNKMLTPLSYNDVESVLGNSFFHKNTQRVDSDMIMRAVESYFKVSHDELLSEKRSKNISHPRQVAMYLIRRFTDMSYPDIGESFNKDHSTVIYADRNIQSKMLKEVSVKNEVERIAELLTS